MKCQLLLSVVLVSTCLQTGLAQRGLRKANKQYELKAFTLAAKSYEQVLERSPNAVEAMYKLADTYRHLNRMEEAARWYERAVQYKDIPPKVYLEYGHVLKALGRFDEARSWYLQYSKADPVWANQMAESCRFAMEHQNDPPRFQVVAESINSPESDFGPALLHRQQVVFGSGRHDIKPQGVSTRELVKKSNLLFRASRDERGFLSQPAIYHRDPADHFNEAPAAFSPDGKMVVFTKNNFVNGTRQIPSAGIELSLFVATVTADGAWTGIHPFPHNLAGYSTGYAAFSEDGRMLYFASDRPGGFGGFDLYVSVRQGNSWSAPENLGPVVNSPGNEITPFVSGNTLYFASDWHAGFGGFDVFKSEQTSRGFTTLVNLGPGVNSTYDDYGFVFDPILNLGYLTSNRPGGSGAEDIYRLSQAGEIYSFRVLDAATRMPIADAKLDFMACGQGVYHTDPNGMYSFQLLEPLRCQVVVEKEGYAPVTLEFNSSVPGKDRLVEILLPRSDQLYVGRVLDMEGQPLAGVKIRATHMGNHQFQEVTSQPDGSYQLALEAGMSYLLRYSAVGYREVNRTIHTGDGTDKSILGIVSLPAATAPATTGPPASPQTPAPSHLTAGWSIQLAAVSAGRQPNLRPFEEKLGTLGPIYVTTEGGLKKVRLGPFELRSDADAALSIVRARGFEQAFIVREQGSQGPASPSTPPPGTIAQPGAGPYKVQVGAFSSMRFFDESKLLDLGIIEKRQKGQLTVVLLSGFEDLEDARAAARKAETRGFKGAFVVQEIDGQLVKVR